MNPRDKALALAVSVMLFAGCATGHNRSLEQRFVRPGEPAVDVGGPKVAPATSLSDFMAKVRHLSSRPVSQARSVGASVEGTDARLAAALLAEAMLPSAATHLQVAAEYRRLGVLDSAYERFNRATQEAPRNAAAYEGLARIWRDWNLPGPALGDAYRAVYFAPGSASARNTLGTVLDALGHPEQARQAYVAALAIDPTAAWAQNNLCYLEFRLGRLREARARCEAAVALAPHMKSAHNNLALTLAASGDLVRAREEFLTSGDRATADYNMGIVDLANRQFASAARRFEGAITSRPDFTAAKARAHQARMSALETGQSQGTR